MTPDGHPGELPIWEPTRLALEQELSRSEIGLLAQSPATGGDRPLTRPKIVFIGAGSTVFAKNLLGDILLRPDLSASRIWLYDINAGRLKASEDVARRIAGQLGVPAEINATLDLSAALAGADYAINMIQVGGYEPATLTDFEVPSRFGLRQTIGDTLGIGGIMRALRTIPVLIEMSRQMERLCPNVLHLNYTNPMAMNCWALSRASPIRTVGLCHSVPHTAAELARDIGVPLGSIRYLVAGINHMAFYLRFEAGGEDLYPRLHAVQAEGRVPAHNRVRYDMLKRLGYFVTESSEHFAEYVPWYIKRNRPDLIEAFNIPLDEYPRRCRSQIADWERLSQRLADKSLPLDIRPSIEYGTQIISAIESGIPAVIYGNVPNRGLITNLPDGCCVELPCLVDSNGLQPIPVGALPPQLAALMQTNIAVQSMTVEAALTGRRDHVYHAAMLDPHTAAELSLDEIWQMVDQLIDAHGSLIPPLH
ncbi:alpha-glucosidase/alpha-galactosidase [Acidisoma cellulosilytica]|uniref:Alpha-glucosidase/alpha-galactosidase n=2 Tax=Acidisoma cellulosilyticum TaxID=2802395 RepID=A0A963Z3F7_9PROT|nr:alpha-glucosidase/alpha-galactosidase [Acidisoma cellulosilyticum]